MSCLLANHYTTKAFIFFGISKWESRLNGLGKPYARFDEEGQVNVTTIELLRHRQTKGAATDRFDLRCGKPAFYSTHVPCYPMFHGQL